MRRNHKLNDNILRITLYYYDSRNDQNERGRVNLTTIEEVQKFLGEELFKHAKTHGFAFLLDEQNLLEKIQEIFGLSRSEALWQMTLFIHENAGPEGDLAIIEKEDGRYFQFRYVEWPSWLPKYVKKPKWHKEQKVERFSALGY